MSDQEQYFVRSGVSQDRIRPPTNIQQWQLIPLRPSSDVPTTNEDVLETRSAVIKRQHPASVVNHQRPSVDGEIMGSQVPLVYTQSHVVARDQFVAVAVLYDPPEIFVVTNFKQVRQDLGSEEQSLETIVQDGAAPEKPPNSKGREPLRTNLERARGKIARALLGALRSGDELQTLSDLDKSMIEWRLFITESKQHETAMESVFDPFQGMIEKAMNAKYKDLKGEGNFLIDAETDELPCKQSSKLPVKDELRDEPSAEEKTWLTHTKREEGITQMREPSTGSAPRHCLPPDSPRANTEDLIFLLPKPSICPVGSSRCSYTVATGDARSASHHHHFQPVGSKVRVADGHQKTPGSATETDSGPPSPAGSVVEGPVCGGVATALSESKQPPEIATSPTPPRGRHDSAQMVSSRPAQMQARHHLYRSLGRK